jgi:hypothetical protein
MTTTFLSNATVVVEQGVTTYTLTGQVSAVSLTLGYASLDAKAMGDTGEKYVGGLQTVEGTITCYLDYGASGVAEAIADIVGKGDTNVTITPAGGGDSYEITGTMFANAPIVAGAVGELSTTELSFTGGTWAVV